jgi:hypothetical protein
MLLSSVDIVLVQKASRLMRRRIAASRDSQNRGRLVILLISRLICC